MATGKIETAFAVVVQLGMAIFLWWAAYWCWPDGIGDIPIASLTLKHLAWIAGSFLLMLFGVAAVFKAFTDPNA